MGFAPAEVGAMSVWEFGAASAGWLSAHTPAREGELSAAEEDALFDLIMERPSVH